MESNGCFSGVVCREAIANQNLVSWKAIGDFQDVLTAAGNVSQSQDEYISKRKDLYIREEGIM